MNYAVLKYEKWIAIFLLFITAIIIGSINTEKWNQSQQGDAAMIFQLTQNIAQTGKPVSNVFAAIEHAFKNNIFTMDLDHYKQSELSPPKENEKNYFTIHTYFLLYLIAPLTWLFSADNVIIYLTSFSFFGMIYLAYAFLRSHKVPLVSAILACLLVIAHPAFSQSIQGQPYVDRFFLFIGFLFAYYFTRENQNRYILILTGILCLMHERTALIAGIFAIGYILLNWYNIKYHKRIKLSIGLSLIILSILFQKVFITSGYYDTFLPHNYHELIRRFSDSNFMSALSLFSIFNILILILIAVFHWKSATIAFVIMLPNIIGHIGGNGEKVGWLTHYHSNYFPVLVWAGCMGLIHFSKWSSPRRWRVIFQVSSLAFLLILFLGLNPDQHRPIEYSLSKNINNNILVKTAIEYPTYYGDQHYARDLGILKQQIIDAVPENTVVSIPEGVMPILYKNRTLNYFPIGIDTADYAVLTIQGVDGTNYKFGGAFSYLGPEIQLDINKYLIERMKTVGYDFEHPTIISSVGIAVIKRIPN
jgi:hypothetical protein